MPRLPDAMTLGDFPSPAARYPTPSASDVNAGAIGQGMMHAARGMGDFGAMLGREHEKERLKNKSLELGRADNAFKQGLFDLAEKYRNDSDPATAETRFLKEAERLRQFTRGMFTEPETAERYDTRAIGHVQTHARQLGTQMQRQQKQMRLLEFEKQYTESPFWANKTLENLTDLQHQIEINVQSGVLSGAQGRAFRQRLKHDVIKGYTGSSQYAPQQGAPAESAAPAQPMQETEPAEREPVKPAADMPAPGEEIEKEDRGWPTVEAREEDEQ